MEEIMQVEKENRMNQETISIAEAKRTFSELLGKVAYGKNKDYYHQKGETNGLVIPVGISRFYHLSMPRLGQ
jgi:hypothetical protein